MMSILLWHAAMVLLLVRNERQPGVRPPSRDNLVLVPLSTRVTKPVDRRRFLEVTPISEPSTLTMRVPDIAMNRDPALEMIPAERGPIDWANEREAAANVAMQRIEQHPAYRDLSALSPEQLTWVRQHHYEPEPSGIPWKSPRVEISEGGFPLIHINDHCIAIPLMMMMVFCQIGDIEPDGTLFERMREPGKP